MTFGDARRLWRLVRDVYTYEGARIWWVSPNPLLGGHQPCDSHPEDVDVVIDVLASGAAS